MKKYILLLVLLGFTVSANAQLQNRLSALGSDSVGVLYGNPTGSTPFWDIFTALAVSTDSIMSSLQKYGESVTNYSSFRAAVLAARAKSRLVIIPDNTVYDDSTALTLFGTDSVVVFDFRNGKLNINKIFQVDSGGVGIGVPRDTLIAVFEVSHVDPTFAFYDTTNEKVHANFAAVDTTAITMKFSASPTSPTDIPEIHLHGNDGRDYFFTIASDTMVAVFGIDTLRLAPARGN